MTAAVAAGRPLGVHQGFPMDLPAQYAEVGVTVVTRPGKLTVCYGKWPIEIDGLPFLKMVIFYSYVKLPEGIWF